MSAGRKHQRRQISSEGKFIKAALAELNMNQREFCREQNIPENRLSDIIHMNENDIPRRMIPWRLKVYETLQRLLKEAAG